MTVDGGFIVVVGGIIIVVGAMLQFPLSNIYPSLQDEHFWSLLFSEYSEHDLQVE